MGSDGQPAAVAVADFNGDSLLDMILLRTQGASTSSPASTALLLQNSVASPGSFSAVELSAMGHQIAAAELDAGASSPPLSMHDTPSVLLCVVRAVPAGAASRCNTSGSTCGARLTARCADRTRQLCARAVPRLPPPASSASSPVM
jgi:hypothetical protein